MIVLPFTAIDVISGLAGSSENCALQGRPALSFQLTRAASAEELTVIAPGLGPGLVPWLIPLTSKGTTAAGMATANPARTTTNLMELPAIIHHEAASCDIETVAQQDRNTAPQPFGACAREEDS